MKRQMKIMMKAIKDDIEGGVMAALGQAAEVAPDLEPRRIANVAGRSPPTSSRRRRPSWRSTRTSRPAAPQARWSRCAFSPRWLRPVPGRGEGAPPPFIPPGTPSGRVSPPVFVAEDRGEQWRAAAVHRANPDAGAPAGCGGGAGARSGGGRRAVRHHQQREGGARLGGAAPFVPPAISPMPASVSGLTPTPRGAKAAWPFRPSSPARPPSSRRGWCGSRAFAARRLGLLRPRHKPVHRRGVLPDHRGGVRQLAHTGSPFSSIARRSNRYIGLQSQALTSTSEKRVSMLVASSLPRATSSGARPCRPPVWVVSLGPILEQQNQAHPSAQRAVPRARGGSPRPATMALVS